MSTSPETVKFAQDTHICKQCLFFKLGQVAVSTSISSVLQKNKEFCGHGIFLLSDVDFFVRLSSKYVQVLTILSKLFKAT